LTQLGRAQLYYMIQDYLSGTSLEVVQRYPNK